MMTIPENKENGVREKIAVAALLAVNLVLVGFLYYCFYHAVRTGTAGW